MSTHATSRSSSAHRPHRTATDVTRPHLGGDGPGEHHRLVILGAGFSGIAAAIRLRQAGIDDFVMLERGTDVGGTWRDNTYPGCVCDVPSSLYSLSFVPNPDWSETFAGQAEIWDYLRRAAQEHDLLRHLRLRHRVTGATWEESAGRWHIEAQVEDEAGRGTSTGTTRTMTADIFIAAPGPLSEPKLPDIPGIDTFGGEIFHSARWDSRCNLSGRRVGVIGTGASAIQLIPQIQPRVARLTVFQRTAPWILPHYTRPVSIRERHLYRRVPAAQRAMRGYDYWARELLVNGFMHRPLRAIPELVARRHLRRQVADPGLRALLTPHYGFGCKRVLLSDNYYPALQRPNVELVTDAIRGIDEGGVLAAGPDGAPEGADRLHELDALILATGFHVTDIPMAEWIRGAHGRTLAEVWQGSPRAYLGAMVSGFPNLFMLYGPNTNLGHNSVLFMVESQLNLLMDGLRELDRRGAASFEVTQEIERSYNAWLQRSLGGTVWNSGGCRSWYLDANGRNSSIWPGGTWSFHRRTRRFVADEYTLAPRRPAQPSVPGAPAQQPAGAQRTAG